MRLSGAVVAHLPEVGVPLVGGDVPGGDGVGHPVAIRGQLGTANVLHREFVVDRHRTPLRSGVIGNGKKVVGARTVDRIFMGGYSEIEAEAEFELPGCGA